MYDSHDCGSTESSYFYRTAYKTDGNATRNKQFIEVVACSNTTSTMRLVPALTFKLVRM